MEKESKDVVVGGIMCHADNLVDENGNSIKPIMDFHVSIIEEDGKLIPYRSSHSEVRSERYYKHKNHPYALMMEKFDVDYQITKSNYKKDYVE